MHKKNKTNTRLQKYTVKSGFHLYCHRTLLGWYNKSKYTCGEHTAILGYFMRREELDQCSTCGDALAVKHGIPHYYVVTIQLFNYFKYN